jgi:hypothetical protein
MLKTALQLNRQWQQGALIIIHVLKLVISSFFLTEKAVDCKCGEQHFLSAELAFSHLL